MREGGKIKDLVNPQTFSKFLRMVKDEFKINTKNLMKKENRHILSRYSRFAFSLMLFHHMQMDKVKESVKKTNSITHNGTRVGQMTTRIRAQYSVKDRIRKFRSEVRTNQERILADARIG